MNLCRTCETNSQEGNSNSSFGQKLPLKLEYLVRLNEWYLNLAILTRKVRRDECKCMYNVREESCCPLLSLTHQVTNESQEFSDKRHRVNHRFVDGQSWTGSISKVS